MLTLAGCGRNSTVRQLPHLGDTPYQQDSILVAYATNPERALMLLDSAWSLGNVSDYRAQFIRAKIYSKSLAEQRLDSAISICKALLSHDSVRNEPAEQENILDMLIAASRIRRDNEQYLQWATQKAELCRQQGQKTERWRTEADIGLLMTFLGQVDEGLAKLDEAISQLDAPGSIDMFNEIDAAIRGEQLYVNAALQRQDICNRFGIRRQVLNELLSRHANGLTFPQYINTIRLDESLRLLRDEPQMSIAAIARAVGFTPANLRNKFKRKYGVTPKEYRLNL